MKIKGSVAIVTGASSGIGLETARLLSQKGAKVVLVARSKDQLTALAKELHGSYAIVSDLRYEKQVRDMVGKTVKKFGCLDILVNNAGRGYDSLIENIDSKKYDELFALLVKAPLIAMQVAIPIMRNHKGGAIVNVSSGTALMGIPNIGAYASLKRALVGLSLTARNELAKDKISVSVVYPFITETNFYRNGMGKPRVSTSSVRREGIPEPDTAEFAAKLVIQAIKIGKEEVFAHDWMGK